MKRIATIIIAAAVLLLIGPPASALPDANVSYNSPTTFKLGQKKVIYPAMKLYVSSDFGDKDEPDMFYGTVRLTAKASGKSHLDKSMTRVLVNRTWTFKPGTGISKVGRYVLAIKGQIREDTNQCGTSPDCTKKVANVERRITLTVKH